MKWCTGVDLRNKNFVFRNLHSLPPQYSSPAPASCSSCGPSFCSYSYSSHWSHFVPFVVKSIWIWCHWYPACSCTNPNSLLFVRVFLSSSPSPFSNFCASLHKVTSYNFASGSILYMLFLLEFPIFYATRVLISFFKQILTLLQKRSRKIEILLCFLEMNPRVHKFLNSTSWHH